MITARLARHDHTATSAILDLLSDFDPETYLRTAGLTTPELTAIRRRLNA